MRYQFIQDQQGQFYIRNLCRLMQVTTSGYYAWHSERQAACRKEKAAAKNTLAEHIRTVHQESRKSYGSPRIYHELHEQGVLCGRHQVAQLMQIHGVRAKKARRFQVTTQSDPLLQVAENILDRQFTALAPDKCWVSDFTYLWTSEGWLYLAVVLDLFSRRIVGWSMQSTRETCLVDDALEMAVQSRHPAAGLLHHSDRGSQYASHVYQKHLKQYGIVCSMSRKGDCWDNAVAESFFSTLKTELLPKLCFRTRAEAQASVFEYIEVWYNRKRRHSTLGYVSPAQFEQRQSERQCELATAA